VIRIDIVEAIANAAAGLLVSYYITLIWLGFNAVESAHITAVFFVSSTVRSFTLRRIFRWIENG